MAPSIVLFFSREYHNSVHNIIQYFCFENIQLMFGDDAWPLSYIYIEEVERKGLGRETGLQLPAMSFSKKLSFFL